MKRIEYYDFLRGVAIVGVISVHAFWTYQDHLKEVGITMFDPNIFMRQLIGFCVPVFVALSGFFLAQKDVSTWSKYLHFLKKQVARVYIPCLIFSLPFLYWGICKSLGVDNSAIELCTKRWLICKEGSILDNVLYYLACGKGVFYFAAVIIQFYILLPAMQWLASRKMGLSLALAISLLSNIVLCYIVYIAKINLSLILYGGLFPFWTVFFVLGAYYGKGHSFNIPWRTLAVMAICLVPVMYAETYLMVVGEGYNLPAAMGNRKFSWILYCIACLLLMFNAVGNYKSNRFTRFMSTAGEYSYGIYLIHLFFLLFVVNAINPHIHWLLGSVLSLLLSMAFIWLCRKISLPLSKKYLGF